MIKYKKSLITLVIIWLFVIILGGIYMKLKSTSEKIFTIDIPRKTKSLTTTGKFENAKFYYPNDSFSGLETKIDEIPVYYKRRDKIEKIAENSFENLNRVHLLPTAQVDVKNVYIKGDTAYIDCDANIESLKEPTKKNLLGIYSIVNSITEIDGINKVKILVDEKEESGNFSRTYMRNMKF